MSCPLFFAVEQLDHPPATPWMSNFPCAGWRASLALGAMQEPFHDFIQLLMFGLKILRSKITRKTDYSQGQKSKDKNFNRSRMLKCGKQPK